ncbi:MAG: hypothetical protein FDX21_03885 [Chlorobium sp.]|nr:MAG: hypothetical protein FDX21_03885 [Chlorobium sp.]
MNLLNFPKQAISARQNYPLHLGLFLLTVLTTLWAGAFWGGHLVTLASVPLLITSLASGAAYSAIMS